MKTSMAVSAGVLFLLMSTAHAAPAPTKPADDDSGWVPTQVQKTIPVVASAHVTLLAAGSLS